MSLLTELLNWTAENKANGEGVINHCDIYVGD
jgi:hypothetical protein